MFKTITLLSVIYFGQSHAGPVDGKPPELICFPFLYASKPYDICRISAHCHNPSPTQLSRHYIIPHSVFESFFLAALGRKCTTTSDFGSNELTMEEDVTWYPSCERWTDEVRKKVKRSNLIYKWTKAKGKDAREQLLAKESCSSDVIQNYFLWLPGNIFIGPKSVYRSDDPGPKFETGARFLLKDYEYRALAYLNTTMPVYVKGESNGRPLRESEREMLLEKIINVLGTLQKKSPHGYSESQWVREGGLKRIKN